MTKSKHALEFFLDVILLLLAFFIFSVIGCKQTTPNLKIQTNKGDVVQTLPQDSSGNQNEQPVAVLGNNMKVVTGQELVTPDPKEKNIETAKDKPGAIAVKVQY